MLSKWRVLRLGPTDSLPESAARVTQRSPGSCHLQVMFGIQCRLFAGQVCFDLLQRFKFACSCWKFLFCSCLTYVSCVFVCSFSLFLFVPFFFYHMHFSNWFWLVWICRPMFTLESDIDTMITIMGQCIQVCMSAVLGAIKKSQEETTFHMDRFTLQGNSGHQSAWSF